MKTKQYGIIAISVILILGIVSAYGMNTESFLTAIYDSTNGAASVSVTYGTVTTDFAIGGDMLVGGDITSTAGDVTVTAGNLDITLGNATLTDGDLTLTDGNIGITLGDAALTDGDLTLTDGNLDMTLGDLTMTAGNFGITLGDAALTDGDLTLTDGNLDMTLGDLTMVAGDFEITLGNATLTDGDVTLTNGALQSSTVVTVDATEGSGALSLLTTYATSGTLTGATDTIDVGIPSGALLHSCSLRVVTAVTNAGDNTWGASLSGGSTGTIIAGGSGAAAKNTKVNTFFDANAYTLIASGTTQITLTPQGANFTAGEIDAVCYYHTLTSLDDAP